MELAKFVTAKQPFSETSNTNCFIEKSIKLSLECAWMNEKGQTTLLNSLDKLILSKTASWNAAESSLECMNTVDILKSDGPFSCHILPQCFLFNLGIGGTGAKSERRQRQKSKKIRKASNILYCNKN